MKNRNAPGCIVFIVLAVVCMMVGPLACYIMGVIFTVGGWHTMKDRRRRATTSTASFLIGVFLLFAGFALQAAK